MNRASSDPQQRAIRPVTRIEIADLVEHLFDGRSIHRADLVSAGERANVREPVQVILATLPDKAYRRLRDLWDDLSHVPIDDE